MLGRSSRSMLLPATLLGAILAIVAACGSTIVPSGSPSMPAATSEPTSASTTASVEPFTPPPVMALQDDEVCLAVLPRSDLEAALGLPIGAIKAQGTDPNFGLTCTFPAASRGGRFLITATTEDPSAAFEGELALATSNGQDLQTLTGVGDQAFYGTAAGDAPEQVVFTKEPVVVRIWNQTTTAMGMAPFADLARAAAEAIRAEIPPAP